MTYTKEQILDAYKKLPQVIKDTIAEIDSVAILKKIGEKYNIHVDQLGALSDEVGLVMFGLGTTNEFSQNIKNKLGLNAEQALAITQEVNENIFFKIREAMKNLGEGELVAKLNPEPQATEKITQIFSAAAPETPAPRVWEQDPYLADPSKM